VAGFGAALTQWVLGGILRTVDPSVRVPVVLVWIVRVRVRQCLVPMSVGVPHGLRLVGVSVCVCMVRIMLMVVFVFQRLVRVFVTMMFRQVQPHTQGHQGAGHQQAGGDGLAQAGHGQHRAEEWRH
jgi:hypothetical protein